LDEVFWRKASAIGCVVWAACFFQTVILWAAEGAGFSGNLSLEGGGIQPPSSAIQTDSYYRLFLQDLGDLDQEFSYCLSGEANWQTFTPTISIAWPLYPQNNLLRLESNNIATSHNNDYYGVEMDRAYLRWASGPLDLSAGLIKPQWGSSFFYRPTDYFFPLSPLQWEGAEALGSEGLDASFFLFDDLSLEGATRFLEGGDMEGVLRLVNKGIGLTVTPSAAWMTGRNAFGLELVGTFPEVQVRLEGTDWLYADHHTAANWTAGFSTSHEGVKYTAEILRDETGEILGDYSDVVGQATYVYMSAEGSFFSRCKASPALVVPLEGGPFLFWPKVSWNFAPQWDLGFQAQVLLGNWKGPLDLYPGRLGLSLAYSI
jgi:hypothetical protein